MDVVSVGAEWRVNPLVSVRAGYAHNTNPVHASDIVFNILAPGIATGQVSGGFSCNITKNSSIGFPAVYALRNTLTGTIPASF